MDVFNEAYCAFQMLPETMTFAILRLRATSRGPSINFYREDGVHLLDGATLGVRGPVDITRQLHPIGDSQLFKHME